MDPWVVEIYWLTLSSMAVIFLRHYVRFF